MVAMLVLLGSLPATADARVAIVATGTERAALLDVSTNTVVARPLVGGPTSAVAVARSGRRGFVAAANRVAVLDLATVRAGVRAQPRQSGGAIADPGALTPPPPADVTVTARVTLPAPVAGIAVSPAGGRVYAAAGRFLYVLDARSLRRLGRARLGGRATALALSRLGSYAAVALTGRRVAIVTTAGPKLRRRVKAARVTGLAWDLAGRLWVVSRGRVAVLPADGRKLAKRRVRLPRGAGGAAAVSPDGGTLAIGAARGGRTAALVNVTTRRVRGLRSGTGPGAPGWSPDGVRIYFADAGAGTLSLVSPFAARRIGSVALGGARPLGIVVQPGLARVAGTNGADVISGTRLRDLIEGLAGDDRIDGGRENDQLRGGEGNDTLVGGSYDDRLDGGTGDDRLDAGAGNDRIRGGAGNDSADAGTGNDSVHGSDGNDVLDGGAGDDRIFGEGGDDQIIEHGFGNDRRLYGGPGNDLIKGGRGSDLIKGGDGNDELHGQTGTENVTGGEGDDTIDGGPARDLLEGNNGSDVVKGGLGDDTVDGGEGADQLDGGSGEDDVYGGEGADHLVGGPGPDIIEGNGGDDTIRVADASRDEVDCGDGSDTVFVEIAAPNRDALVDCETVTPVPPEAADDGEPTSVISGTRGNDLLRGTPGEDSMFGKAGRDRIFGGGGDDYVDGEWGPDELHGGPGDDIMAGRSNNDTIYGDAGNDSITGDRGHDVIHGGHGSDKLFGNLGPDRVNGGPGNDRINVVAGERDIVTCGPGKDTVLADPGDRIARDCERVSR